MAEERIDEKLATDLSGSEHSWELDLNVLHETRAGRLVVDPEEAKIEFGATFAAKLKLSQDGAKVLWPQPTDSPDDPQNVCHPTVSSGKLTKISTVEFVQETLPTSDRYACYYRT